MHTTRWSLVQAAGNSEHPGYRDALARLCQVYWPAVYAFVRLRGYYVEDARELTQGFFTRLLDKKSLKAASPDRGKFRSFLLASVKHYVNNEWQRANREKRGGGAVTLRLDFDAAESTLRTESTQHATPETIFEKRWALSTLRAAMERLGREMDERGKGELFRRLRPVLTGGEQVASYRELAAELDISDSALKVTVHRLRKKFGKLLRDEVRETLVDPKLIDDEMRYLLSVLAS